MRPDPRPKKKCVVCGKVRQMPRTHHKSIDPAVYLLDPFCSTECCRRWHGVPVYGTKTTS